MDKYINQMRNVKYNIETKRSYSKKKGSVYHSYCNDILTFDIETTSAWLENGKVKGYEKGNTLLFNGWVDDGGNRMIQGT